jgi:ADP-ribose pyrophosphatase YjhB (NUDIX family)
MMTDLNESSILNVAAAVIGRNGSVLVARRAKGQHLAQKWEFPGGKIEENESPQECLHRELRKLTRGDGSYPGAGSCAHSNGPGNDARLNCVLKGRAAWYLFARLAGWNPN